MAHLARPPRVAALVVLAAMTIGGCGASPATPTAPAAQGGPTRPAVTSTGAAHLTGNLCTDAATANASIRALTEAIALHTAGHQQAGKLLTTIAATYTALGSEAPAQIKGALAALAGFYHGVEATIATGRQLSLSDIEPASHPGLAAAVRQVSAYLVTHCG
jgi:hypothetical protein